VPVERPAFNPGRSFAEDAPSPVCFQQPDHNANCPPRRDGVAHQRADRGVGRKSHLGGERPWTGDPSHYLGAVEGHQQTTAMCDNIWNLLPLVSRSQSCHKAAVVSGRADPMIGALSEGLRPSLRWSHLARDRLCPEWPHADRIVQVIRVIHHAVLHHKLRFSENANVAGGVAWY
jgi:hypothetical protein